MVSIDFEAFMSNINGVLTLSELLSVSWTLPPNITPERLEIRTVGSAEARREVIQYKNHKNSDRNMG